MISTPPQRDEIDTVALSQIFNDTTNSYKLVFFQALLNLLEEREKDSCLNLTFNLKEIAVEILNLAWYPHTFFRLSFGVQDQISKVLDRLKINLGKGVITSTNFHTHIKKEIWNQYDLIKAGDLLRYVPYRLLTPFFPEEIKEVKDWKKNRAIAEAASARFSTKSPPIYQFSNTGNHIEIHPLWRAYLVNELAIIKGWVRYQWVRYLQERNPNTPAVVKKITPPAHRSPLTEQTEFWRRVLENSTLRCVYTGEEIDPESFTLDHFVPWSFVCHDQPWNLIPVSGDVNSQKGYRLPLERDIRPFIEAQLHALKIRRSQLKDSEWLNATESYVDALQISHADLLNSIDLSKAYRNTLGPLISLAQQMGFPDFHRSHRGTSDKSSSGAPN